MSEVTNKLFALAERLEKKADDSHNHAESILRACQDLKHLLEGRLRDLNPEDEGARFSVRLQFQLLAEIESNAKAIFEKG